MDCVLEEVMVPQMEGGRCGTLNSFTSSGLSTMDRNGMISFCGGMAKSCRGSHDSLVG